MSDICIGGSCQECGEQYGCKPWCSQHPANRPKAPDTIPRSAVVAWLRREAAKYDHAARSANGAGSTLARRYMDAALAALDLAARLEAGEAITPEADDANN